MPNPMLAHGRVAAKLHGAPSWSPRPDATPNLRIKYVSRKSFDPLVGSRAQGPAAKQVSVPMVYVRRRQASSRGFLHHLRMVKQAFDTLDRLSRLEIASDVKAAVRKDVAEGRSIRPLSQRPAAKAVTEALAGKEHRSPSYYRRQVRRLEERVQEKSRLLREASEKSSSQRSSAAETQQSAVPDPNQLALMFADQAEETARDQLSALFSSVEKDLWHQPSSGNRTKLTRGHQFGKAVQDFGRDRFVPVTLAYLNDIVLDAVHESFDKFRRAALSALIRMARSTAPAGRGKASEPSAPS